MAKTNETAVVLEELKHCGEMLIGISEKLSALLSEEEQPKPAKAKKAKKAAEPESEEPKEEAPADEPEVQLTLTDVRAVLAEKSRAGYTDEVKDLITKYGADKLSDVDPKHYAALLADAEVLGDE